MIDFNLFKEKKENWLRGWDLNPRPPGYEPDELPGCSTPRPFSVLDYKTFLAFVKSLNKVLISLQISPHKKLSIQDQDN